MSVNVSSMPEQVATAALSLLQPILTPLAPLNPQPAFKDAWISMTENYTDYQISTWGSFIVQVTFYFGMAIPGFLFQFLSFMKKYKVQQAKQHTLSEQWACIRGVMLSKGLMYFPLIFALFYTVHRFGLIVPVSYDEMPTWYAILPKMVFCLMVEDTWHYWAHRALHHKKIYGIIHKIHHTYNVPFGLAAEYAHPIETIVLGIGFFLPIPIICNHIFVFWAWLAVRMYQTTDVHSGFDVKWLNPLSLLPMYGGVRFHDFHHSYFNANYASTFTFWDWVCGTDKPYYIAEAKRKAQLKGEVAPTTSAETRKEQ
jgi:methylsterol monooxygenase